MRIIMKRIISFFAVLLLSLNAFSQVASTTQGIDCYNDTGNIFLVFDTTITILSIEWQYSPHNVSNWLDVDTINTPFVELNSSQDSLRTNKCGLYKAVYIFDNGIQIYSDSIQWSLSCPLTMGQGLDPILCFGDSSGILKRPVYGGDPFVDIIGNDYYYYEWIFAQDSLGTNSYYFLDTTEILSGVPAGWYKTIVTDSIGCTDTIGFIEIKNPPLIVVETIFIENINCIGMATGKLSYQVYGGKKYNTNTKYFYYLIMGSDTIGYSDTTGFSTNFSSLSSANNMQSYYKDSIQFDDLVAGEYLLIVVDSNSCLMFDTIIITQPEPYQTFASTTYPLLCESDSGYLKIDSVLGGGNILYGFTGSNIDSIYVTFGWYEMYIEDLDFNCIDTVLVRCYAQYEIDVYESITNVLCFGEATGSVIIDSITGGNLPYDVQWGSVDNFNLFANTYFVDIVDAIGCVHSEEYIISQPNQILPNEDLYPISCFGMSDGSVSINLTGGIGQLSYYWMNGTGTSDSLYGLPDGIYSLIVSDSVSCIDTFNLLLQSPQLLDVQLDVTDSILSCNGETTIINVVISGGTGPYSILWGDGDVSQQRVVGAGYYSVTVTDASGCESFGSISIIEPDPLSISISFTDISCSNGGIASVSVNGGTAPIDFLWNTGDTTLTIDSLWELTYWVVATDSCGFSVVDTVYLSQYELITELYYDDSSHTAQVEIVSVISSGPFEHEWMNIFGDSIGEGEISPTLCEGTYFVLTTDLSNNCFVIDTFNVEYYLPLGILDITTTTVYPDSNLWGFEPYTYLWDNGEISQHANICPGNHWVEVTDKDGCMVREDFVIEQIIISLDPGSAILECNLENIDIDLEASAIGGIEPYSFEWWNGSTENPINLGMSPGDFSVSIIDDNGCAEDTSFSIATMTVECIPNVFTPNGDNINDTWSLEDTFLYEDSEVKIYGRFGRLIFHSVGYHDQWDGTNENENDLPAGVYFYSIEIGHGFDQINGTVTILR